ncbi:tripartite tricarboxylate transporter substrate-binding protein [Schlegelella sp. S2-27]|uniref:Tripartite tricarboxylate transporter substrate-binding protein n=1 Tax=Caldimonas mangrovi TaxID=2944811 RepID=A0ABT0YVW6_9BURK|nr:tripartite tricarboxylate transporter substrate-binding protein [Caldimonas mangrovi]MCM5682896.1 tripartite tricarboxylate transporter substrate-binding protein [Caldimonas mangrovi]
MKHTFHRRHLLGASAGILGSTVLPGWAQAARYPNRPITLVVPFTPGGSVDISGRAIAERLGKVLGQTIVVENRGGAGGAIGTAQVAKSAPDGYTLIVTSQTTHAVNPAVTPKLPYNAETDFAPITLVERLSNVLLVNAALPVKTFEEFVAFVRAHPGKWNYASSGNGSVAHLSMELLKARAGLAITHVPYKGAGVALNDLLAGFVQVTWNNLTSNLSNIVNGKLRALAVASPQRVAQLPSVPTFNELKLPELNHTSWTGLAAPAGTPDAIVSQLYEGMRTVLGDPATKQAWEARGAILPEAMTPDQYKLEISERIRFYRDIVKTHKIGLD